MRRARAVLPDEFDGEPQIGNAAGAVFLHQDVFALQVSVCDGRFSLRARDLRVQVAQTRDGRVRQPQQGQGVQRGGFEVVVQRSVFMIVCDQIQLRPRARAFDIRGNETCKNNPFKDLQPGHFESAEATPLVVVYPECSRVS